MGSKGLNGVKHARLDMTARDKRKGAPDKGHTTSFSPSKLVDYFPIFRSYFGMEYEQPWNMGKILLETIYTVYYYLIYYNNIIIYYAALCRLSFINIYHVNILYTQFV